MINQNVEDLLEEKVVLDIEGIDRLYMKDLRSRFEFLLAFPEAGRRRDEIIHHLRSLAVKQHVVFYRYAWHQVQIVRILHGRQDVSQIDL